VNGEEHRVACDGGGPEMVRVTLPEQQLLRETRLGEPGAERTKWRCTRCRFATYNPEVMARHAIREAGEGEAPDPERISDLVLAERGALARDCADGPRGPAQSPSHVGVDENGSWFCHDCQCLNGAGNKCAVCEKAGPRSSSRPVSSESERKSKQESYAEPGRIRDGDGN
jgi:hypothetical protein